jgi:hypothetical protein
MLRVLSDVRSEDRQAARLQAREPFSPAGRAHDVPKVMAEFSHGFAKSGSLKRGFWPTAARANDNAGLRAAPQATDADLMPHHRVGRPRLPGHPNCGVGYRIRVASSLTSASSQPAALLDAARAHRAKEPPAAAEPRLFRLRPIQVPYFYGASKDMPSYNIFFLAPQSSTLSKGASCERERNRD